MNNYDKDKVKFVLGMVIFIVAFMIPTLMLRYYTCCQQAKVYNKQHNTQYTCSDFFWASEQINTQTQTIEIKNK